MRTLPSIRLEQTDTDEKKTHTDEQRRNKKHTHLNTQANHQTDSQTHNARAHYTQKAREGAFCEVHLEQKHPHHKKTKRTETENTPPKKRKQKNEEAARKYVPTINKVSGSRTKVLPINDEQPPPSRPPRPPRRHHSPISPVFACSDPRQSLALETDRVRS